VHELAVQFYPDNVPWSAIHKQVPTTADATARAVRRKLRPPHLGRIGESAYRSEDGGPRLMRSVIPVRSCHGHAEHETQKPVGILLPLIESSCAPGGLVADWFMGSGSTGVAALESGRSFVGCELLADHFAVAERRCAAAAGGLLRRMAL
jgi:site-specific DNA-methyltransferase (adenine-specific)